VYATESSVELLQKVSGPFIRPRQITFFQMAAALHDFITVGDLTFQNEENFFLSTESRYNSILVTF
jgi:hypothetical protein